MSVHLVGGGRDVALSGDVYGPFVAEAAELAADRHGRPPEIGLVVVHEVDDPAAGGADLGWFTAALDAAGPVRTRPLPVAEGGRLDPGSLAGLDGLLVAGGLTPAYAAALAPAGDGVRALVAGGAPYLGFSAGAAVAPGRALVGGYRLAGTVVTAEDNGEECDELTVVDGLGLVEPAVDVHAAQWGTVTRLVSAVAAGLVPTGVAVDEGTVLVLAAGRPARVAGAGRVWWVGPAGPGVGGRAAAGGGGLTGPGREDGAHPAGWTPPFDRLRERLDSGERVLGERLSGSGCSASARLGAGQNGAMSPAVWALAAAKRCWASAQLTTFHHALA